MFLKKLKQFIRTRCVVLLLSPETYKRFGVKESIWLSNIFFKYSRMSPESVLRALFFSKTME